MTFVVQYEMEKNSYSSTTNEQLESDMSVREAYLPVPLV